MALSQEESIHHSLSEVSYMPLTAMSQRRGVLSRVTPNLLRLAFLASFFLFVSFLCFVSCFACFMRLLNAPVLIPPVVLSQSRLTTLDTWSNSGDTGTLDRSRAEHLDMLQAGV